jgi:hypothetical protein
MYGSVKLEILLFTQNGDPMSTDDSEFNCVLEQIQEKLNSGPTVYGLLELYVGKQNIVICV